MSDYQFIRLCHQQFQDHIWRDLENGYSFSEARERAIVAVGLPPPYPADPDQQDADEYSEEMSIGGRPWKMSR